MNIGEVQTVALQNGLTPRGHLVRRMRLGIHRIRPQPIDRPVLDGFRCELGGTYRVPTMVAA